MKKFDKFILWFFSLIMLIVVIFSTLLVLNLFGSREILDLAPKKLFKLISEDRDFAVIAISVLVVFFILSIKGFLFQSKTKKDKTDGILLENNNGKLLISRETLENLVRDISKNIQGTESTSTKIYLDDRKQIVVNINAIVYQDAVIKEVTMRMQNEIKSAIKQASDLEVSEVNVNIEKISSKISPEKKQEELQVEETKKAEKEQEKFEKEKEKIEKQIELEKVKETAKSKKTAPKEKTEVKKEEKKTETTKTKTDEKKEKKNAK